MSLVLYPNPILEQISQEVSFPLSKETENIISKMWESVKSKGVGIASPQIGHSLSMFIVNMSEDVDEAKNYKNPDFILINPKITFYSESKSRMIEGCLSFPGQYGYVIRSSNIVVEYQDEKGKKQVLKAKKWLSRIIQHEYDHLEGKLFIKHPSFKPLDEKDLLM
jgi:peptide deformylase